MEWRSFRQFGKHMNRVVLRPNESDVENFVSMEGISHRACVAHIHDVSFVITSKRGLESVSIRIGSNRFDIW